MEKKMETEMETGGIWGFTELNLSPGGSGEGCVAFGV